MFSTKRKILIIDDEWDFARLVGRNLEEVCDYQVRVTASPLEGLRLAESYLPDLILLDIIMPELGGLEVLRRLKADPKTLPIPVVMLSAVTDDYTKQQASAFYDASYIQKPVETGVLKETIEGVLSRLGKG